MRVPDNIPPSHPLAGSQVHRHIFQNINREAAEKLLSDQPLGTYLFRKGEEEPIIKYNVHCPTFTLTWKAEEEKYSEKVIVHSPRGYLFYDDDLEISGTAFSTLSALLSTLDPPLTKQLIS